MESNLQKKAYFQSRRGLQELDIILKPFVENHFSNLKKADQLSYMEFVDNEDIELLDWLVNQTKPPNSLLKIVNLVIEKHLGT